MEDVRGVARLAEHDIRAKGEERGIVVIEPPDERHHERKRDPALQIRVRDDVRGREDEESASGHGGEPSWRCSSVEPEGGAGEELGQSLEGKNFRYQLQGTSSPMRRA